MLFRSAEDRLEVPVGQGKEVALHLWQRVLSGFEEGTWPRSRSALGRSLWQTVGRAGTTQGDWVGMFVGKLLQKKTRVVLSLGRKEGAKECRSDKSGIVVKATDLTIV